MPLAARCATPRPRTSTISWARMSTTSQNVIDLEAIRNAKLRMGVDPLGGAGVHYWPAIAERYRLDLTVVNDAVDATFRFMTRRLGRQDPHGSVLAARHAGPDRAQGQLRHRLRLRYRSRPARHRDAQRRVCCRRITTCRWRSTIYSGIARGWRADAGVGKTVVSSQMIDRVATKLGRRLYEVPVGFKWFVDGLVDGSLGFGGEESAGAAFLRKDGTVWTTDKDGIVPALLSAEITARTGRDPGEAYRELTREFGAPSFERIDAAATPAQKKLLGQLTPERVKSAELAGEKIQTILTKAPGNGASIGGLKVIAEHGWFAARPSGTEDVYKIYAESYRGVEHLRKIQEEAQGIVAAALM